MQPTASEALDQVRDAVAKRIAARLTQPAFEHDAVYRMAMKHALDLVDLEIDLAKESWI